LTRLVALDSRLWKTAVRLTRVLIGIYHPIAPFLPILPVDETKNLCYAYCRCLTGSNKIFNTTLITGIIIVNLALIFYTVSFVIGQKRPFVTNILLSLLTLGVTFDIVSTAFMIAGSRNIPFTAHGVLGYSALLTMLIDTALLWRYRLKNGAGKQIPGNLILYNRIAFGWWVAAYIAGGVISVILRG
jgi:hypothetical protein